MTTEVDKLHVAPCLPAHWPGFTVHYRYRETVYHIGVVQGVAVGLTLDGVDQDGMAIPLVDDRHEHTVALTVA